MLYKANLYFSLRLRICNFGHEFFEGSFPACARPGGAMPGSSLWREPALQARPGGSAWAARRTAGPRHARHPRSPLPRQGSTSWPHRPFTKMAGQTIAPAVSTLCQQNRVCFQPIGKLKSRRKSNRTRTRMCTHAFPHPPPRRVQQAHSNFLSSSEEDAKTRFARTAAIALPALLRAAGLSFHPKPNL